MKDRNDLHRLLLTYCRNVYFQPPESQKIQYPCIIYSENTIDTQKADNRNYLYHCSYDLRYITKNPDDPLRYQLLELPYCQRGKHYAKDNLHHYPYTIYY